MRGLRNTEVELRVTVTNRDGEPADAAATPTITVTRDSDGSAILTDAATTKLTGADGVYYKRLTPAQTAEIELFLCEWKATVDGVANQIFRTEAEIVGRHLCSLDAIADKARDGTSTDDLRTAREWAEDVLEEACGVAFRARYASETVSPYESTILLNSTPIQRLLEVRNGTTDLTSDEVGALALNLAGSVIGGWTTTAGVRVAYVHGYDRPPAPISRAALQLALHFLSEDPSDYDQRATRIETEDASYQLVTAGVRQAITSLPEVNAAIDQFSKAPPMVF